MKSFGLILQSNFSRVTNSAQQEEAFADAIQCVAYRWLEDGVEMWNSLDPQDSLDQLGRNLPEIAWSALSKLPMAVEAVDTSAISENTMQQHPRRGVKQ